jgi:D-3-phosphoglycerate dehydrogenase / 2-oxoglutarate reductase
MAFNCWSVRATRLKRSSALYQRISSLRKYGQYLYFGLRTTCTDLDRDVHIIGIRSKTELSAKVLREGKNLLAIGCFCIGTNQVDLNFAAQRNIAVFTSPFSNSRSVAELIIGEIIALARQMGDRSGELHRGIWNKKSNGCFEIRGKTLGQSFSQDKIPFANQLTRLVGIVGYGHVGSQVSVLAEAMGMRVVFHDIRNLMGMGNAQQVTDLNELLTQSDFVILHVPDQTKPLISTQQLDLMKVGSYLLNASRGSIVDIAASADAVEGGSIAGAALDVFPHEPRAGGPFFDNSLNPWTKRFCQLQNIILTPHIGGSTEEAQAAIGAEGNQPENHVCAPRLITACSYQVADAIYSRWRHGRVNQLERGDPKAI